MLKPLFSGTGNLIRFILRRDRLRLSAWICGIVVFTVGLLPILENLFGDAQSLAGMAEMMGNPAMVAMVGPTYGDSMGALYAGFMLVLLGVLIGVMNIFLVTRHTRQDEEFGRQEMIRSLPVGRLSGLYATLVVVKVVNILIALGIGFGMAAFGIENVDLTGSLLLGAAMGACGLVFAGATAVFCQLCSSNRTASALSLVFLMASYMLRAMGDVGAEALSLISPLGLLSRTQAYVENDWRPVFVLLGAFIVLAVLALVLNRIRDLGQGMVPARGGKRRGGLLLTSPLGLALRLTKTALIGWGAALILFGVMYGSVLNEIPGFISGSPMLQAAFAAQGGASPTDQFVALLMVLMSVLTTVPIIGYMLRVHGEEKQGFTEKVLAGSVSRSGLFGSYFGIAFAASVVFQFFLAFSLWGAAAMMMDAPPVLGSTLQSAFNYLPAIWVFLGLTALLIGVLPNQTGIAYGYLGLSFFLVYIGAMVDLAGWEWVLKLSPYGHVPRIPVEDQNFALLIVLTGIAAALTVSGFAGYRRRDLKSN